MKEALDRAAAKIGERFKDQPLVEAAIRTTIGEAYNRLSDSQLAVAHLERAVALRKVQLGPDHPDTLASMHSLAVACNWVGRFPDAIALYVQILEILEARLGPDHAETLACVRSLAMTRQNCGDLGESVRMLEQLLEKERAIYGPRHQYTLGTMHHLAMSYEIVDRFAESMALHEKVLELHKSKVGPEHNSPIWCMLTFAQVCQRAGKLDRADQLLREVLEQNWNGEDSPLVRRRTKANALGWLALNLLLQQQYAAAETLVREAVAIWEKQQPNQLSERRFYFVSLLGDVLLGQKKYVEAEPLLLQGYEGMKQREDIFQAREHRRLTEAGERVVRFYEATNQPEKARAWRVKLNAKQYEPASGAVKETGGNPAPLAGNERRR